MPIVLALFTALFAAILAGPGEAALLSAFWEMDGASGRDVVTDSAAEGRRVVSAHGGTATQRVNAWTDLRTGDSRVMIRRTAPGGSTYVTVDTLYNFDVIRTGRMDFLYQSVIRWDLDPAPERTDPVNTFSAQVVLWSHPNSGYGVGSATASKARNYVSVRNGSWTPVHRGERRWAHFFTTIQMDGNFTGTLSITSGLWLRPNGRAEIAFDDPETLARTFPRPVPVPLPASGALLVAALAGLAAMRRRAA